MKTLMMSAAVSALLTAPVFAEVQKKVETDVDAQAQVTANADVKHDVETDLTAKVKTEGETDHDTMAAADLDTDSEHKQATKNNSEPMEDIDEAMDKMDYAGDSKFFNNDTYKGASLSAAELIGKFVYTSEMNVDETDYVDVSPDWDNIGEVSDIVMSPDGRTKSILLDIGGFLGLGEHTVAVNMDELKFVRDGDDEGDYFIVVNATKDELMAAPEYDRDRIGLFDVDFEDDNREAEIRTDAEADGEVKITD